VSELDDVVAEARAAADLEIAASAWDRAFARSRDPAIASERKAVLDRLAVAEHGMRFRYIPGGTFLMGAEDGDPDERPVHPVELDPFWIADVPVSWALFCEVLGWEPPPAAMPKDTAELEREIVWSIDGGNRIRLQYCEDQTLRARDWHAHQPALVYLSNDGAQVSSRDLFGSVTRADDHVDFSYARKPMVAVGWQDAELMAARMSTADITYRLPTEAEWEKAARGGLAGEPFPWGREPPRDRCDCERFDQFGILPSRRFPPNAYGVYAMSGGVSEWTADGYDARAYGTGVKRTNPRIDTIDRRRVLRGGSWADCAHAVRVSFRMALDSAGMLSPLHGREHTPTVGFRLARVRAEPRRS
jgi:formylglycine-generating enzyme required for sulfatase activity